VKNSNKFSR